MFYVVLEVGCLECGLDSQVVGVFTNHLLAEQQAEKSGGKGNHGDYKVLIEEILALDLPKEPFYPKG